MTSEYNPPQESGGVTPMTIAGRMTSERERLQGMSDMERAWRAQWLKDQVLAADEPVVPENYYRERYNPLRRFYRAPLDVVENGLRGPLGEVGAGLVRHIIGKTVISFVGACFIWYHFKYNRGDWTKKSSWKVTVNRPVMLPLHPGYPNYPAMKDDDYASFGFKNSPI